MTIEKGTVRHIAVLSIVFMCMLFAGKFSHVKVHAAVLNLDQVQKKFETAIANGNRQITFQTSSEYTMAQLQKRLSEAAKKKSMLFTGEYIYQKLANGSVTTYTFQFTNNSLIRVKFLKSRAGACKAALIALKNADYTTKFYSENSYYSVFLLMMRQHPEYNYNTKVWKNTNGTYGYSVSSEITIAEQKAKMKAADKKASAFAKKNITKKMTDLQKILVVHDYLVRICGYDHDMKKTDGYEDSFTAYGALVKRKAVCQGYTAAFNLLAQKAGIYSIGICGTANGASHTWNYVKVGNKYRHFDSTWNDTLQKGPELVHEYFNITGNLIGTNHSWTREDYKAGYIKYCKYLM